MCLHTNIKLYPKGLKTKTFTGYKVVRLRRFIGQKAVSVISANYPFTWNEGLNTRTDEGLISGAIRRSYSAGIHVYRKEPSGGSYPYRIIMKVTYSGKDVIASGIEYARAVHVVKAATVSPKEYKKALAIAKPKGAI